LKCSIISTNFIVILYAFANRSFLSLSDNRVIFSDSVVVDELLAFPNQAALKESGFLS